MKNTKNYKYYFLGGILLIITLWLTSWGLLKHYVASQELMGQFGDMFGAVNSLFSGLALCGITYTIFLQYESNSNSQYQFKFNHLLDTINKQIDIFNSRIKEFNFEIPSYLNTTSANLEKTVKYYNSIKHNQDELKLFCKTNNINISALIGFMHDSNKFIYNLIDQETIDSKDKDKLKKLYSRSLNRNIIDFLSMTVGSLEFDKEELADISEFLKEIKDGLFQIKVIMVTELLKNEYP